jgi:CheY-like chemotaxis protein
MSSINILLVEDNEGDILLTKEAFEETNFPICLSVAKDGKEAIDFLAKCDNSPGSILPDIVLLDINLPKKNGHEVLQFIKEDPNLKHIPVIILTTSSSQRDINLSYNNHANSYITKPVDVNEFFTMIKALENFWLSIARLPKKILHDDKR